MGDNQNIHETKLSDVYEVTTSATNTSFEEAQRIEGGGRPNKVFFKQLPKPIRIFGYFFIGAMLIIFVFAIIMTLFD
jgi:hypothetical protein